MRVEVSFKPRTEDLGADYIVRGLDHLMQRKALEAITEIEGHIVLTYDFTDLLVEGHPIKAAREAIYRRVTRVVGFLLSLDYGLVKGRLSRGGCAKVVCWLTHARVYEDINQWVDD
jgi:hypothetical protein